VRRGWPIMAQNSAITGEHFLAPFGTYWHGEELGGIGYMGMCNNGHSKEVLESINRGKRGHPLEDCFDDVLIIGRELGTGIGNCNVKVEFPIVIDPHRGGTKMKIFRHGGGSRKRSFRGLIKLLQSSKEIYCSLPSAYLLPLPLLYVLGICLVKPLFVYEEAILGPPKQMPSSILHN
jgi:hypothetical protein